jgi:hypothetical protein
VSTIKNAAIKQRGTFGQFRVGQQVYKARIDDFGDGAEIKVESAAVRSVGKDGRLKLDTRQGAWGHHVYVQAKYMAASPHDALLLFLADQETALESMEGRLDDLKLAIAAIKLAAVKPQA